MKATYRFALLVLGALLPALSHADLVATEYFNDYGKVEVVSNGSNLNGGTGWTSAWLFSDEKYLPAKSISYAATGYNNAANFSGIGVGAMAYAGNPPLSGGSTATRSFTTSSTTVWFSALISIDETWDRAVLWIDSIDGGPGLGNDFIGVLDGNIQMRYNGANFTTAGAPTPSARQSTESACCWSTEIPMDLAVLSPIQTMNWKMVN